MAGKPVKVDFSKITELAPGCNWPLRPLNNTHCMDITYGEYMNTLNNSVTIYLIVFWIIQLGGLALFAYRYRSLMKEAAATEEPRSTLKWFCTYTLPVFLMGADARSNFGITPLWWYRMWAHWCIIGVQIVVIRFALGFGKALSMKKSKATEMAFKVLYIIMALNAVLSLVFELPFLVYPPGKGIGTYYGVYECTLLIIQIGITVGMVVFLLINWALLVTALIKSEKTSNSKGKHRATITKISFFTVGMAMILLLFAAIYFGRLRVRWGNEYSAYIWAGDDIYPWKGMPLITNFITLCFIFGGPKALSKKSSAGSTAAASSVADSSSFGGSSAASSSAASSSAASSSAVSSV